MKAKPFYEVLEEQIRSDLRKEIEAEVRSQIAEELRRSQTSTQDTSTKATAFERPKTYMETWLASHVNRQTFNPGSRVRQTYGAPAPVHRPNETAQAKPRQSEPVYEAKSVEEICALELLRRHGARVGNQFTATELKTAWRKAALQTHPDRFTTADIATQARMSAAFRELCEAYEMLQAALEIPLAA